MPLDSTPIFSILDRVTDANGDPVSGGSVEFYDAGTTTPKTVYSDSTLATSLGSTVNLDSGGYPVSGGSTKTMIYTGTAAFKCIVKDADGVALITHDNVPGAVTIPTTDEIALPETPVVSRTSTYTILTTDQAKLINADPTGGSFAITLPSAVTVGDGWRVGVRHSANTTNVVTVRTTGAQTIGMPGQTAATSVSLTGLGHARWFVSDGAGWTVDSEVPPIMGGPLPYIKVTDRLTAPPASPTGGARYIINGSPTGAWSTLSFAENQVVESDGNGSWLGYTPANGWMAWVDDEDLVTVYHDSAWEDWSNVTAPTSSTLQHAVYQHQEANGTVGGTPTTGAWTKRTLNTETVNTITGASLASGQITLPVGTYLINFRQEFYRPSEVQSRIKVISGTASPDPILTNWALWYGLDSATDAPSIHGATPSGFGVLTVTATAVIELQYYVSANFGGTSGLGAVSGEPTGSPEVYARVAILSLAAQQGPAGVAGPQGEGGLDAAHPYQWDTGTTAADPGSGKLRLNNANPASTTTIYMSDTTSAGGSMTNIINSWDTSTSTIKGRLRFSEEGSAQNFQEYFVTAVSDSGSYFTITVTYINHSGSFTNGDSLAVLYVDKGDVGETGPTGAAGAVIYNTRSGLAAATVDTGIDRFWTNGYATVNDGGGAAYKKLSGAPSPVEAWHFQTANGIWLQLDVNPVSPKQLGAVTGSSADQTTALQAWLDYAAATGAPAHLDGSYRTDSGIIATGDGIQIYGNGNDVTNTGISPTELQTTNANVNGTMLALRGHNIVCRDFAVVGAGTRAISGGGRGIWIGDDYTTITDAAMTSGSPTLTSASSSFSASDVGKYIHVAGAGTGGVGATFGVLAAPTPTTLTLSANAGATVSGATAYYANPYRGVLLQNISTSSHGVGIEFGACFESGMIACHLSDFDALKLNCVVAPDGGDCFFEACHFSANATSGKAVHILAGGGPRFTNCKALTTQDYFYIDWRIGISGGPLINGCSLENGSGRFLFVTGSGSEQLNGLQMQNCWLNSGATIVFDNVGSAWCHRVLLENNNIIGNGTDSPIVDFGSSVDWFRMTGGIVDGNSGVVSTVAGAAVGINVRSGATYGVIDGVMVKGCTTRISNSSTTTIVRDLTQTTQQFSGTAAVRFTNTTDSASNPALTLDSDRATPANNDTVYQSYRLSNASGTQVEYARITVTATDVTAASEDGAIQFGVVNAGALSQELYLSAGSLQPNTDGGLTLGASGAGWSSAFLASLASINIGAGNWIATHTSGILTVGTGDLRVTTAGTNTASVVTVGGSQTLTSKTLTSPAINSGTVGTTLNPSANDAATLGQSGTAFSDLFLAPGAVINFDASNVTITHAANKLTIAGVSSELVVNGGGSGSSDVNIGRFLSGAGGTQISFQNTGGTAASVSMGSTGGGNFDLQAAASRGLLVRKAGGIYTYVRAGPLNACYDIAIPAGGTAGEGVTVSSTSNFGMFFGSGAPTLSAAQGSLYLRSDGSSASTRLYVNTNGTTGWTNVTTAA